MNLFHISISVINIICGISALAGYIYEVIPLLSYGIFFGYFANLFAVLISLYLVVLFIIRIKTGREKELFSTEWLGFTNGAIVLLVWVIFLSVGQIPIES